jgi:hypothetical protein
VPANTNVVAAQWSIAIQAKNGHSPDENMTDSLRTPNALGDQDFHVSSDCPFAAGITSYVGPPSAEYLRRCNWCTERGRPTPS